MINIRIGLMSVLTAALLAACGGGETNIPGTGAPAGAPTTKGSFTAVVNFGDSLSDVGTYSIATSLAGNGQPPFFGGKWTTNNGSVGTVWVENLAASMGLMITPAVYGWGTTTIPCPAKLVNAALAGTCTGYAQGGAQVTDPKGFPRGTSMLTVPVVTQIANHLAAFGSFKASDLILVWAGDNDLFVQFYAFVAAATQIQTDAALGKITADQANQQLFAAQTVAQNGMKQAAQELAGYVRDQILAKGGKYVAVITPVDIVTTPSAQAIPASLLPLATTLVDTFNLWLRDGLTGQPVQIIDANAMLRTVNANPTSFGFVNNTVPACDANKIAAVTGGAVTSGSSLFCNATPGAPYNTLLTGADANTWFFADSVHPTTGGHLYVSNSIGAQLKAFGWL